MKNLLNEKNAELLKQREIVFSAYNQIVSSYKTTYTYISNINAHATIKFNGNTRVSITPDGFILAGFGFRRHPNAEIQRVSGCSDEGTIHVSNLTDLVNTLAEYESILPIK